MRVKVGSLTGLKAITIDVGDRQILYIPGVGEID